MYSIRYSVSLFNVCNISCQFIVMWKHMLTLTSLSSSFFGLFWLLFPVLWLLLICPLLSLVSLDSSFQFSDSYLSVFFFLWFLLTPLSSSLTLTYLSSSLFVFNLTPLSSSLTLTSLYTSFFGFSWLLCLALWLLYFSILVSLCL